jgi:ribose transport system ATP-binding protein
VDEGHLARLMVGRALASELEKAARDRASEDGRAVLRARGLARSPRLKPVDLELRAGEIVGVFGLVGAGRTRLARALFGLDPPTEGTLELFGRIVSLESPSDAIRAGMGYLGEDRSVGIVPRMSVAANVTLASLRRIVRGRVLDFRRERRIAQRFVDDLSIRVSTVDQLADTLSGGNQQKLVLARWLCSEARVLVLDDPTRGIDVGAKEEVFRLVRRLAGEGTAILYLTSEIREARTLPHRLLVMAGGRVVGEMDPATPEEEIMRAAGGVSG